MVSDSEKMTEIDTDDTASVASIMNSYDHGMSVNESELIPQVRLRRGASEDGRSIRSDTSDDILAKYRSNRSECDTAEDVKKPKNDQIPDSSGGGTSSEASSGPKPLNAFEDAKKKLRLVLSSSEGHHYPICQKVINSHKLLTVL
ncbi:unnamed protein product [Nesidiocoris tenuis]|uniref:Uncharacterized protein n=1 Tax=Nesidiocoris tenuis TaxID=355587 RepID=A0A6H5H7U1_9HEMI|nr:unnamed protein product [Nesidiocoris tenuis]